MGRIILNSGLNDFLLIDTITHADSKEITGFKMYKEDPPYLGVESLAQLGAFHVRFVTDFAKHAFLLGIKRCTTSSWSSLKGPCLLSGTLTGFSSSAFSYGLGAEMDGETRIQGEFLFAAVEYSDILRKEILQSYYKKAFVCLKRDSSRSC
jgi:hypothetical protein